MTAADLTARFHFRLTAEPLSADRLVQRVTVPAAGAVATFAGVVRSTTTVGDRQIQTDYLVYEAYAAMAHKQCLEIAQAVFDRWPVVLRMAVEHRTGRCAVGEPTVLVAVSSPHRGDGCFEACRFAIERLKAHVPIWKQENTGEQRYWLEGTPDAEWNLNPD